MTGLEQVSAVAEGAFAVGVTALTVGVTYGAAVNLTEAFERRDREPVTGDVTKLPLRLATAAENAAVDAIIFVFAKVDSIQLSPAKDVAKKLQRESTHAKSATERWRWSEKASRAREMEGTWARGN